jgi:hypothetical protein
MQLWSNSDRRSFTSSIEEELTASDLAHIKYAPSVSPDVERTFSNTRMRCRTICAYSPPRISACSLSSIATLSQDLNTGMIELG